MKKILCLLLLCFFMIGPSLENKPVFADEQEVTVQLPDFSININGINFDKEYNTSNAMFPLFLYKGVTYYPLTGESRKLLNIKQRVTNGERTTLEKDISENLKYYMSDTKSYQNQEKFKATIIHENLKIDNETINKEYSLLEYGQIVYIPLTWDLIVNKLNGQYQFNEDSGLNIHIDNYFNYYYDCTIYVKDDIIVRLVTRDSTEEAPSANLYIDQNGEEKQIGIKGKDYFGYQENDAKFVVKDGWIYTSHSINSVDKAQNNMKCKINIFTGEIIDLN